MIPPEDITEGKEKENDFQDQDEGDEGNDGPPDDLTKEEADFISVDKTEQIKILKELAKRKGYDLKTLKYPLEKFSDDNLIGFLRKLHEMDDVQDDDIPY